MFLSSFNRPIRLLLVAGEKLTEIITKELKKKCYSFKILPVHLAQWLFVLFTAEMQVLIGGNHPLVFRESKHSTPVRSDTT